jgi:transcriptional regulator with GAF, ATPase, and Fis domain
VPAEISCGRPGLRLGAMSGAVRGGAAARLGLKRTTLQSRMQKYKIARQYQ